MIKFVTDDGKVFDTKSAAIDHDKELQAAEQKKKMLQETKEARAKEVEVAYKAYVDLANAYRKDYSEPFTIRRSYDNWGDFIKDFI